VGFSAAHCIGLHSLPCGIASVGDGFAAKGSGQSPGRHVDVNGFDRTGVDAIGFVPDADRAVSADAAIEPGPRREMLAVTGTGVGLEFFDAAPVLQRGDATPVDEELAGDEAEFRMLVELFEHGGHRRGDPEPLRKCPKAVDSHSDEKDDERLSIGGSGSSLAHDGADVSEFGQCSPPAAGAATESNGTTGQFRTSKRFVVAKG